MVELEENEIQKEHSKNSIQMEIESFLQLHLLKQGEIREAEAPANIPNPFLMGETGQHSPHRHL